MGSPVTTSAFWAISTPTAIPLAMLPVEQTALTPLTYSTDRFGIGLAVDDLQQ